MAPPVQPPNIDEKTLVAAVKQMEKMRDLSAITAKYATELNKQYKAFEEPLEAAIKDMNVLGKLSPDLASSLNVVSKSLLKMSQNIGSSEKSFLKMKSAAIDQLAILRSMASKVAPELRDIFNIIVEDAEKLVDNISKVRIETEGLRNAAELTSKLNLAKPFDAVGGFLSKIPLLGKSIQQSMQSAGAAAQEDFGEKLIALGPKSGNVMSQIGAGFSSMAGQAKSALTGIMKHPWLIVLALAVGWIVAIFEAWQKVNKATEKFADETGAVNGQLLQARDYIVSANVHLAQYGVTLEVAGASAAALANAFQNMNMLSKPLVEMTSLMVSNLGMTAVEAADYAKQMKATGDLTDAQLSNMTGLVARASELGGVMPKKVLQDMAKSAKTINLFFRGNIVAAAKQAVELNRMGLSLEKAGAAAEKLLDWDTSISAEMEASVMLGRQVNLQNARWLAWNGDIAGATKEILNQVGSLTEFNSMNILQKKALAAAAGMEVTEIATALKQREQMAKWGTKEKQQYEDALKGIEDLNKQNTLLLDTQKQFATQKLSQAWDKVVTVLTTMLVPLIDKVLLPLLEGVTSFLRWIGIGIEDVGSNIAGVTSTTDKLTESVSKASIGVKILGAAFALFFGPAIIIKIATGLWSIVTGLYGIAAAGWAAMAPFLPLIAIIAALAAAAYLIYEYWEPITAWFSDQWDEITDIFTGAWNMIKNVFVGAWDWLAGVATTYGKYIIMALFPISVLYFYGDQIKSFFTDVIKWVKNQIGNFARWLTELPIIGPLFSGLASIGKSLTGIDVTAMQEGGVVSKPTMAVIGEAGPEAVVPLEKAGNISAPNNEEVVKKLDELIAVMRNGFGVYMDGVKVGDAILKAVGNPAMSNAV